MSSQKALKHAKEHMSGLSLVDIPVIGLHLHSHQAEDRIWGELGLRRIFAQTSLPVGGGQASFVQPRAITWSSSSQRFAWPVYVRVARMITGPLQYVKLSPRTTCALHLLRPLAQVEGAIVWRRREACPRMLARARALALRRMPIDAVSCGVHSLIRHRALSVESLRRASSFRLSPAEGRAGVGRKRERARSSIGGGGGVAQEVVAPDSASQSSGIQRNFAAIGAIRRGGSG